MLRLREYNVKADRGKTEREPDVIKIFLAGKGTWDQDVKILMRRKEGLLFNKEAAKDASAEHTVEVELPFILDAREASLLHQDLIIALYELGCISSNQVTSADTAAINVRVLGLQTLVDHLERDLKKQKQRTDEWVRSCNEERERNRKDNKQSEEKIDRLKYSYSEVSRRLEDAIRWIHHHIPRRSAGYVPGTFVEELRQILTGRKTVVTESRIFLENRHDSR